MCLILISSDSNWPLKGSQWDEIVSSKNSYICTHLHFRRYLWKVSTIMELTEIGEFIFRDISTHCEDCWSGKSWWHLKTEKDRRLFYCVLLWYQGEALLKIRASGTGGGGATYAPMPHQPIKHNKTIADLFLSLNVTNFFRFNNLHNALKDLWRRILQFSLIQLYYWLFIDIS